MKKVILIVLTLLMILSCLGITACGGGGEENGSTSTQTQAQQQNPTGATTASAQQVSGDSGSWGVPIYPGTQMVFNVNSEESEIVGDNIPAVYEARMYTSSDDKDKVVNWYKDKMPASGWTETLTSEMGSGAAFIGQYEKNGGNEIAVVTCSEGEDATVIKLDWKYPK